jgi:tetraacyldisaccharide 4'-kinase
LLIRVSPDATCLLPLTGPAAFLYGLGTGFHAWLYRQHLLPTRRLPLKVLSVGNLVAGGTGKTPHTALLARYLHHRGIKTAVLSRGYGGTKVGEGAVVSDGQSIRTGVEESGEEPLWLARKLEGIPVVIGRDRFRSGMICYQQWQTEWVVLDDGFQHRSLARDLDILLLPGHRPLNAERLLPLGMLREPLTALRRAHLILISHAEQIDPAGRQGWLDEVRSRSADMPVFFSEHRPSTLWRYEDNNSLPLTWLKGKKVLAFCGLADPSSFLFTLRETGADPVRSVVFPDHHHYREKDKNDLAEGYRASKVELLITTEKDALKLGTWPAGEVPLLVLGIEVAIPDPAFWQVLDRQVGLE